MPRLFGTDGVRGVAGVDLTAELATSLAAASVVELAPGQTRPLVVVGRDPRPSGQWLQDAVVDGLTTAGADVALLGVIPTPAVARAVADGIPTLDERPTFGVMISASHNPADDNGIKFFAAGGLKLSDDNEDRIEAGVADAASAATDRGTVRVDLAGHTEWYVDALLAAIEVDLAGLRVVVDCANGAASTVAEAVYSRAGASVTVINTDTSGPLINANCGATHLEAIQAAVAKHSADVGISHDGDADRCLAVTAAGDIVDGDAILAVLALDLASRGGLSGDAIAATVMSNLGLSRALRPHGIDVVSTAVGDRAVSERMRADGLSLGGEQSGHVVMLDVATTGDGLLTGLALLRAVVASGRSLGDLAAVIERMPQVLVNVKVTDRDAALAKVEPLAAEATKALGDRGRVLVRPSGTEPLIRVMVEAETIEDAEQIAERIAAAIR